MPETGPSRILVLVLAIVVIAAGIGTAVVVNYYLQPKSVNGPLTVQAGDNVTVNYIGLLGSGPQKGKVFDTSEYSAYQNNATWPKALTYQPRPAGGWTPLPVYIGASGQYTLGGVNFTTVVTGFWQGMIGAQGNQSRWITIPWQLGYGPQRTSCFRTAPLSFSIPVLVTVSPAQFTSDYPNANATLGATFPDPAYNWTDYVVSVNASAITVQSLPKIGETSDPYGWTILVTNVSATTITLENEITVTNYGNILGTVSSAETCGSNEFIVTSVNLAAGTFTEYWSSSAQSSYGNPQVAGETMIFIVTPVNILPPGTG
jgi:hypothetical protein